MITTGLVLSGGTLSHSFPTLDQAIGGTISRVLIPFKFVDRANSLMPIARALSAAGANQVILAAFATVEQDKSLSQGMAQAREARRALETLAEAYSDLPLLIDPRVLVSYNLLDDLSNLIEQHVCDTVLLGLSEDGEQVFDLPVDDVLSELSCRVLLMHREIAAEGGRILLASRGGDHAAHAVQIARALGLGLGKEIDVFHAVPARESNSIQSELLLRAPFEHSVRLRGSLADLIDRLQAEMSCQDTLVLGASAQSKEKNSLGPRVRAIMDAVQCPMVIVYAPHTMTRTSAVIEPPSLSLRVDRWFAENTFDAEEFSDLERLVRRKQAQGVTISLGLPALNEEATIAKVITTVRDALMRDHPLLDEIVVIDSNSTDRTVEIAESLGVPVYRHSEILPETGSYIGKGEALWKSLYILSGNIIAWVDTDIVNIHPRFVYGLVGPLLVSPQVQYVKGFYRRPLRVGDKLQAGGGGRVTELVARPMLNLFFPELSGVVQPLSGEYAGRREMLERVPFFHNYAVETGLLIDVLGQFGLSAIAQVDLKERIHHNQQLVALSKMSNMILQALFERLNDQQIIAMHGEPSRSMKLVREDGDQLYLDIEELSLVERPPMITVPAYRSARQITADPIA